MPRHLVLGRHYLVGNSPVLSYAIYRLKLTQTYQKAGARHGTIGSHGNINMYNSEQHIVQYLTPRSRIRIAVSLC